MILDFTYMSYGYSVPLIAFLAGSVIGILVRGLRAML